MYAPNILITNFCNQNCSFCFASKLMKDKDFRREISLSDFEKIIKKIKENGLDTAILMGGEPTLHSKFHKIVKIALNEIKTVQIMTNGLISKKTNKFLQTKFPRVTFHVNISTPGYQNNLKLRKVVNDNILKYSRATNLTLSLTIDDKSDISSLITKIPVDCLKNTNIRIGVANPIAGTKNAVKFDNFPKIGSNVCKIVKNLSKYGNKIFLSCGFTRCMFSNTDYKYLIKKGLKITGFGCFGKASSMDITTSLSANHCFPLSHLTRFHSNISKDNEFPLKKLNALFLKKRFHYWQDMHLNICKTCKHYGHTPNKCPGPCLAFIMNKNQKT